MKKYLKYLFQLILSPRNGWEDIERAGVSPRRLLADGYYPLITLAALSTLVRALYHHTEVLNMFVMMVVWFVVYFVGFFFGVFILSVFLEPQLEGEYDEERCLTFVAYVLGLEALITIVMQCVPITPMVLFFLPIYVALVEWKSVAYMKIKPERVGIFMIIAILGVLLPPYVFHYIFTAIL